MVVYVERGGGDESDTLTCNTRIRTQWWKHEGNGARGRELASEIDGMARRLFRQSCCRDCWREGFDNNSQI
jgi:hypothetical protein